ncbi:energy-coupling factor transporter transmembrane protein EcfT [Candidatus Poribacteria bacterium]|nr:energy-coupling factor transporter transmembrane protein EcfT [Candidatus Poribacteria bacterium]
MDIYLYNDKNSFIHRLHPITKIINLLLLFAISMTFNHPAYVFAVMVFVILIAFASHSMANIRKILYLLIMLILFCGILWPLFLREKNLLWKFGPISIYRESLLYAVAMGLRLDTMLMCGMIFLTCTRIEEFTAGLNKIGMPFSVSFALSLAFRLVPTFAATSTTVVQAQKSRGLDLESGWILSRLKKHIPLFIPIFIYAVRNADLLAMALESKSFGLRKDRSYYREFRFTFADFSTIIFLVVLFCACLYMRLNKMGFVLPRL